MTGGEVQALLITRSACGQVWYPHPSYVQSLIYKIILLDQMIYNASYFYEILLF